MFDEFIERYAGILSRRDVFELFNRLRDLVGTTTEAARICNVERRTPYYWKPDEGPEIRLQTKQKVLKALIERDFEFALKFMIERSAGASRDMLRMYFRTIYEKAMDPEIQDRDFKELLKEFRQPRVDYSGLIDSLLAEELSDKLMELKREAERRHVDFQPLPLSTMTAEEVVRYLPCLISLVPRDINDVTLDGLSRELNFPREIVKLAYDLRTVALTTLPAETREEGGVKEFAGMYSISGSYVAPVWSSLQKLEGPQTVATYVK